MHIEVTRGLDLRLRGAPEPIIDRAGVVSRVALVAGDYAYLKPVLTVALGDRVRPGQTLFTDRRYPELRYASPGGGRVAAIQRGPRRSLLSVVIELDEADGVGELESHAGASTALSAEEIRDALLRSGLWTALRARPFSVVPPPKSTPRAVLVTAIDTNPWAADPGIVIGERAQAFAAGVGVLSRLGKTFVCTAPGTSLPPLSPSEVTVVEFDGPHPAGLPGTHVEYLAPAGPEAATWYVGYQDVIAIGALFTTGRLMHERIVALAGPGADRPRLVRTRLGASLDELLSGELRHGARVFSGSVLAGRATTPETAYLGRYDTQISVLGPTADGARGSLVPDGGALRQAVTARGGWPGMLAVEAFERVWPLASPPLPLLRALLARDGDTAEALGCLGLAEEDLALCSYLCPGKLDYGAALRATLDELEREHRA